MNTDKPRIRLEQYGIWWCRSERVHGCAYSPAAAYRAWLRNATNNLRNPQ